MYVQSYTHTLSVMFIHDVGKHASPQLPIIFSTQQYLLLYYQCAILKTAVSLSLSLTYVHSWRVWSRLSTASYYLFYSAMITNVLSLCKFETCSSITVSVSYGR